MADGSVRRNVTEDAADSVTVGEDGSSDDAIPKYGPWVSFYGFFHRFVRHQLLVFGGLALAGAFAVGRFAHSLVPMTAEESIVSAVLAVGGAFLLAFGLGYFVVRHDTSCCECGTGFAKERVRKRLVRREVRGRDRQVIEETLECQECDERTTEIYAYPEQQSHRW